MPGWQDKVVTVMLAETSDLRELARMVGHDPETFWRDANFRHADLAGQDLSGLDLSAAILPVVQDQSDASAKTEPKNDPAAEAQSLLAVGRKALDNALVDWPHSDAHFGIALSVLERASGAFQSLTDRAGELTARYLFAKALILRAHAKPRAAKPDIVSAEGGMRKLCDSFTTTPGPADVMGTCFDARVMAMLFKSRLEDDAAASETLEKASSFLLTHPAYFHRALLQIRKICLSLEVIDRSGANSDSDREKLRENTKELARIMFARNVPRSPATTAAATINHCAHRLKLAQMNGQPLSSKTREDMRHSLSSGMKSADYLDWIEAQRCLTALESQYLLTEEFPASDPPDMAEHDALRNALARMKEGDMHLRKLISATDPDFMQIDRAISRYEEAEHLFGLSEDIGPVEGEPGQFHAVMRRGVAYLLRTADETSLGEAKAEAVTNARSALDLAAANLGGRNDVPLAFAEALDAQAFGLRLEAHFSTKEVATQALAEAAALHRRASRVDGLPRAVSYRYRTHFFGAERELEERQAADPSKLHACRVRAHKALISSESRISDRTSNAEQASHMAVLAEYAMSVTAELKLAAPQEVKEKREQSRKEIDQHIEDAMALAAKLLMPLDWILLCRTRAQLQRVDQS